MTEDHSVSRRASLKSLGAVGAAMAFGAPPQAAKAAQDQPAVNAVDLAADRMTKGHS